jgi:hypothetical protein
MWDGGDVARLGHRGRVQRIVDALRREGQSWIDAALALHEPRRDREDLIDAGDHAPLGRVHRRRIRCERVLVVDVIER